MSSLPSLERLLAPLDLWPRDILYYLFLVAPTPITIRHPAAFFHGNAIPPQLASEFVQECSSPTPDLMTSFRSHYTAWDAGSDTPFIYRYYDMWFGPVVHIRCAGCFIDQRRPDDGNMPLRLGFSEDIFPLLSCAK